jgi:hypothetical protein
VFGRYGEPMSMYAAHGDVLDGPAGALQDEPVGDLGRSQALRAPDELKRETVHFVSPQARSRKTKGTTMRRFMRQRIIPGPVNRAGAVGPGSSAAAAHMGRTHHPSRVPAVDTFPYPALRGKPGTAGSDPCR